MKKKIHLKKFKDTFASKYFIYIIIGLLIFAASIFLFLYNNFKETLIVDLDGYMLGVENLENLKSDEVELKTLDIVKVKGNDYIYQNGFKTYFDNSKKKKVNVDYPLFANDGLAIVNYNERVNLLDSDLQRVVGEKNLVLSYGKKYDSRDYTQMDQESYLFLTYKDGIYINLYDLKIDTVSNSYTIPTNSIIYFLENKINYFERKDNKFVRKTIEDIDYESKLTFYYSGQKEKYEYTYEEILIGIDLIFVQEEIPDFGDLDKDEQITDIETEVEVVVPEVIKPGNDNQGDAERPWEKPVVKSSELTANVYSIEGSIKISDPAGVIKKAPTYTMYVDNKVYSRRTFYGSGNIVIGGLTSETTYQIIGQYTYLDSDFKTQKLVTFYVGSVTTKSRDLLEKIDMSYVLGEIYSKKIELNDVKIVSDLNSEALRGVRKVVLKVNKETYNLSTKKVQSLINGNAINIDTAESLTSNRDVEFEIIFYDRENNVLIATNNKGKTRTCKKEPTAFLKLADTDTINVKISIDLRNDDKVELNNYRYVVTNSSGKIVAADAIKGDMISINDLDPNQIFTLKVLADIDIDNNKGLVQDYQLGIMELSTLPISSLGFVNLKVTTGEVKQNQATINVQVNKGKTDAILLKILNKITVNLYEEESGELVDTKVISGLNIQEFVNGINQAVTFSDLESNTKYLLEFKSLVKQGSTEYDLDCIYNLDNFETTKKPAVVLIANSFTSNNMIDFDCMVIDEDGAILSEEVYIELRDEKKNIVKAQFIDVNTEEYIRITYNNLQSYHNYTVIFYANEYNETNINSEYKSKYELKVLEIFTEEGIGGKIELLSSLRKATGKNIADLNSEIKWIESQHHYTIPKTIDEEGDMHIYSKNGASAYSYDLNDYTGQLVTATFKIKAITPVDSKFKLYFSNHINGSSSANYGIELSNISTTSWKSYTFTFVPGYYYDATRQIYIKDTKEIYGKRQASFAGFHITGGTAKLAEYEIRDFSIQVVSEKVKDYPAEEFSVERGQFNGAGNKSNHNSYARLTEEVKFQGGYYYTLNFDVRYVYLYLLNEDGTLYKSLGWYENGTIVYVPSNKIAKIMFRNYDPNEVVDLEEVNFSLRRYSKLTDIASYQEFTYDLITKVRVNVVDLRSEITNRDYFIRVYEAGELVDEYNYVELVDVDRITTIKEIALAEHKNYNVELGIKIRDRYFSLSMFDISTAGEVQGIETLNDWYYIQPRGNYILLNDLSFKGYTEERASYGYRYFYGTIDFQGYTMSTYSIDGNNLLDKIYRTEKSAVLKNLVLDIHYQHTLKYGSFSGFVYDNFGTIENVYINIYDETASNLENSGLVSLVTNNQRTGVVRNFVVNVVNKTNMYRNSSLLVYNNNGLIENGYIYGSDIEIDPEYDSADPNIGMIFTTGNSRSTVNRVFTLPSLLFKNNSKNITGLIGESTNGVVSNSYTVGATNHSLLKNGPGVGSVGTTATLDKVYYINENIFNNSYHQKINATALNDVYFQQSLLGDYFDVSDMIKLGFYPQVRFTSQKMPQQPYIELPKVLEDNLVDIVSMEILEQTNSSAVVEFNVSNPEGENITKISISDLDVTILEQEFSDGKSKVKAELTNPDVYISKYPIRSISSVNFLGYSNTRDYDLGEKYADISFYREIKDINDWKNIKNGLNQNYSLLTDLDMYGYTTDIYIGNFSGKIEGNNHTISNVTITKAGVNGLFSQMNGTLQNIIFENFEHTVTGTYGGVVGYSNQYGRYNNVHVKNIRIYAAESKTTDNFFAGPLVGNATSSRIQNCSSTDSVVVSKAAINNIAVGGLVGYSDAVSITNSYVQNINLQVLNSISVYGVGGLAGRVTSGNAYISGCYTTGNLLSNNTYNGGLIGHNSAIVEKNYSAVNVTSDLDYTAGIIGYVNSNAANLKNNLYVGNLYSLKQTAKIALGIEVDPSNYALSSSLVNGVKSDINNGESIVSYEDLLINETYSETILLGEDFQYTGAEEGLTPKVFIAGTDELVPYQRDNYLYKDMFEIQDIVIDKHAEYANVVLYLKNPDNYIVTDVDISDVEVNITKNANENNLAVIEIKAYPERFFDSYKLSKIYYKETEDGEVKEFDKNIKIDMIFYKYIKNYDDWQNISKTKAENYLLMTDIDFSNRKDVNVGIVINRLETTGEDEYHTLSGIELSVNKNVIGTNIIQKVISGMKNIIFDDIKITDTSNGTNNYSNLIMYNYGDLENLTFKNITIDSPKENFVGIVGSNYGPKVNNITMDNITVKGRETIGGLIAQPYNNDDNKYNNINASNITILAERGNVGGIFGNMPTHHYARMTTNITIKDSNITSTGSGVHYIGGISGLGDCSYCYVDNVEVTGARYVGALAGYQRAYDDVGNKVVNSRVNVTEYYGGGMYGQSLNVYDSNVSDTTVSTTNANAYGAGGFVGIKGSYNTRSCGVTNVTVTGSGTEHGGFAGRMTGGSLISSYVQDSTINGASAIGGIAGAHMGGTITNFTATRSLVNATESHAGGVAGIFGNTEISHGAVRQTYVTDIDIRANSFAGGLFGGVKYSLIYPSYVEKSYFEGSVVTETGKNAGPATGDNYNEHITRLFKMGFYEKATINKDKIYSLTKNNISGYNIISDNPMVLGKYLDDSTGAEKTHYSYPNAAYTGEFIELEKDKTYQFGVNSRSGADSYRILFYDKNGKFLRVLGEGNTNYFVNDMNTISTDKIIFTSLKEQKIRIYFYRFDEIEYYYLSEYNNGPSGIRTDQLLNYTDIRSKYTWTRYINDNTSDYYYYSKLLFDENYHDFSPLNYQLPEINMVDLSENKRPLTITGNAINKHGILMDGKYNEGVISGYKAGTEFTINAKITDISNTNPNYQFFFLSEDMDSATQNGFGAYVGGRQICVRIKAGHYCSGFHLSRNVPMDVTISYNGVDTLKFYKNGELYTTTTLKRPLVILDTAKTMIAPPYKEGTNIRRFEGALEYLKVFNRTLSDEEVKDNYNNSTITNTDSLELYYDFTDITYQDNDGYYPTLRDYSISTIAEGQILTQLPDDMNRDYIVNSNNNDSTVVATQPKLTDDKLENIFNVYASSINTVNLEFDDNYTDLSFSYKNGDYQSDIIKVSEVVYSLNYDFNRDLEITINSSNDSETFKYTGSDLVRKIKVLDDNYYHISDGTLYKNNDKVIDNALHIYDNLVLLKSGKLYNLITQEETNFVSQTGVLANPISLYTFDTDSTLVKTYYGVTEVTNSNGSSLRKGQMMVRDGNMFVFDYNKQVRNDMNVFSIYNTKLYQISLKDNSLISVMNEIKYPAYFNNSNIVEVAFDKDSENPIILVRYDNDYIYGFNYNKGKEVFEYGTKQETSLFGFIADSFSGDTVLSASNDSYKDSKKLKKVLINLDDEQVKDKLNSNVIDTTIEEDEADESIEGTYEKLDSVDAKREELTSTYIQVYDYDTNTFEVYNTNDLLNPTNTEVLSERIKIKRDAFLYNYFYDNKINRLLDGSKILIYCLVIGLVLVNLIFFIKYLGTKELKKHG